MIQYYLDLEKQVKVIKELTQNQGQIQKIYSTSFYISISIRSLGKSQHLLLGRGGGYEGLWSSAHAPKSQIRRKDVFLEYLRKHLSSCGFLGVSIDNFDRIIKISYQKFGKIQSLLLFWKARQLYFVHHYQDSPDSSFKLLKSWRGKSVVVPNDEVDLYECFNEVGRNVNMEHIHSTTGLMSATELLHKEWELVNQQSSQSAPRFLERKKENIIEDLRKAKQWEKLQALLDKGTSLKNIYELKVEDHKVKFEGELNEYERRNIIFGKIKKLKRGESILSDRLKNVEEELQGTRKVETKLNKLVIIKPVWGLELPSLSDKNQVRLNDDFKVVTIHQTQFGIGLNTNGNDQLRNKWANKDDYWLHLDGLKSAHLIIKVPQGQILSTEILNIGASILARFSDFKNDWIPIVYTQVKNLKGVSGIAGMVIYKKEKHLRCQSVSLEQIFKD